MKRAMRNAFSHKEMIKSGEFHVTKKTNYKHMKILTKASLVLAVLITISSCQHKGTPKARGYFRFTFPEHSYQTFDEDYPYTFDLPVYAKAVRDSERNAEKYWINIEYPQYKGIVHISYKEIDNNLQLLLEDSRNLAYKHAIKADAIGEKLFLSDSSRVYGILYDIKGDAASSVQFFLTDSVKHFLRGSLYFDAIPNKDSLAPVVNFVKEDIMHLMETVKWK